MAVPRRKLPLLADLPSAPRNPHSGTPPRAPGSVRRTAHWNLTWPTGPAAGVLIKAVGRDLVTRVDGSADVSAEATMCARVDSGRTIRSLRVEPSCGDAEELVGCGGGRGYRARLQEAVPEEMSSGTLTYCLLDDMPGVTLIGPFALSLWPATQAGFERTSGRSRFARDVAGICSGWRPDGPPVRRLALGEDPQHNLVPGSELAARDDALSWHDVPGPPGNAPMVRRRRRLDIVDGPRIFVDALFRDSMWGPDNVETVVHEYGLRAMADRDSMRLTSVTADPRVLPFPTCPAAADNVDLLIGEPLRTLRRRVLELVVGTDGCTHLNDAVRALADVPVLLAQLR